MAHLTETAPSEKTESCPPKAIVLLSGGLDSATVLALAQAGGRRCYALSFLYGQRHTAELHAARALAEKTGVIEHRTVSLDLASFGGSSLTDATRPIPKSDDFEGRPHDGATAPPSTYVPARNTIFLAYALAYAEVTGAREIHVGVNAVDSSGYPDCRPEFIDAFQQLARVATAPRDEAHAIRVVAPLLHWSKAEIIRRGTALGVDYGATVTCYDPSDGGRACGRCEACHLRARGFREAGVPDPTRYASHE